MKLIRFLQINLTQLNTRAIEAYLKEGGAPTLKWESFMMGVDGMIGSISEMTYPEISIYVYALNKRNENKVNLYSSMLGGG